MKIGLYGGTFDPVHSGHISIAQEALRQFKLDELWFIPAKIPPHKIDSGVSDERHRLNMLKIALNNTNERFRPVTYELDKDGISYTYLTLADFHKIYKDYKFYYIIGEDSLNDFAKWKHPEIISQLAEIIVAPRVNTDYKNIIDLKNKYNKVYGSLIHILDLNVINISSTNIRNRIKNNQSVVNLLNKDVIDYIKKNNLYR